MSFLRWFTLRWSLRFKCESNQQFRQCVFKVIVFLSRQRGESSGLLEEYFDTVSYSLFFMMFKKEEDSTPARWIQ